jgi:uncharacterized protein (DUF1778 family)
MAHDPFSSAATAASHPARSTARSKGRPRRDERLSIRLPQNGKELIQRAAELEQRSVTDFCTSAAVERAQETVARAEQLEMSARDRAIFFEALMNPPAPSEALRQTLRAAKSLIGSE